MKKDTLHPCAERAYEKLVEIIGDYALTYPDILQCEKVAVTQRTASTVLKVFETEEMKIYNIRVVVPDLESRAIVCMNNKIFVEKRD